MSPESTPSKTKVCPTCGTRLSENATRCLVCGTEFNARPEPKAAKKIEKSVQASRMPAITLSLPAAIGILLVVIIVAAAGVYFTIRTNTPTAFETAETATPTLTPTASLQPTATQPPTDVPTPTLQPPFDYTVSASDGSCSKLAFDFNVSVQSIIITNNLPSSCPISVGQKLKIPFPTPTIPAAATSTPLPEDATKSACLTQPITVQDGDTLSTIAANYAVPADAIKAFNGKTTDNVFIGENLLVPLCMRAATPGPTPTATIPPPYPAPNLLLPADGAAFTLANDVVTLQWASVGTLRDGEAYQITVEDVTADQPHRLTDYVTDTKFIIPTSYRPKDNVAHVLRWWITPVRTSGTDDQGQPIWTASGAVSDKRVFTWVGVAVEGTPNQ
jgi:LysM repeat protein/ribosomal protein L40E